MYLSVSDVLQMSCFIIIFNGHHAANELYNKLAFLNARRASTLFCITYCSRARVFHAAIRLKIRALRAQNHNNNNHMKATHCARCTRRNVKVHLLKFVNKRALVETIYLTTCGFR